MKFVLILTGFLFFFSELYSQDKGDFQNKEKELKKIKLEIKDLDQKIEALKSKQQKEVQLLDEYDNREKLIKNYLDKLNNEEEKIKFALDEKNKAISILDDNLKKIRKEYADYLRAIYRYRTKSELEMLISSNSINEALVRIKYMQKFSEDRERKVTKLKLKADEIDKEKQSLQKILKFKSTIRNYKVKEESELADRIDDKRNLINDLKNDRDLLIKEIERKRKSAEKISAFISELIIRENALRSKRTRELKESNKIPKVPVTKKNDPGSYTYSEEELFPELPVFSSFVNAKGRLPWPVSKGKIINRFGENKNEKLNTITLNFGVDIETPYSSDVKAVADGVVSILQWLPGYGNIVIIKHSENFRTVYANLLNSIVKEGQLVRGGDYIGKSGESVFGPNIHFEIWKDRDKQNPEIWLAH